MLIEKERSLLSNKNHPNSLAKWILKSSQLKEYPVTSNKSVNSTVVPVDFCFELTD